MSDKKYDRNHRWRCVTIGFRVSPQENELINELVELSGMEKQEYIVNRLQNDTMNLTMNSRIYLRIVTVLNRIYKTLNNKEDISETDEHLLSVIAEIMKNCKIEDEN